MTTYSAITNAPLEVGDVHNVTAHFTKNDGKYQGKVHVRVAHVGGVFSPYDFYCTELRSSLDRAFEDAVAYSAELKQALIAEQQAFELSLG